jgi:starch phosphorylase
LPESFGENTKAIQREIVRHVEYTLACPPRLLQQPRHAFRAVASSLRDRMWERFNDTEQAFEEAGARRLCYLSIEFLMGRALCNAVQALGLTGA